MKNYLFYVSQLYSLSIMRPLQAAIRQRGDDCAWFFDRPEAGAAHLRADEKHLKTVAEVKSYNPLAVFVPGNVVPDFFPGIKVQIFHGLATDDTGKKGHYRIRGFFDLYCTRGPQETATFQTLAEQHGHFCVVETGWPKLDPLFAETADLSFRNELGTDKPIILYASTFSPSLTSAPTLYETIRSLAQSGRWHWLVTLHPKMDRAVVASYRALAGPHLSFFESHQDVLPLLKTADAMLCDTSSIAIEFQMLNKPLVTYRTRAPGPQLIDVSQPAELQDALAEALRYPETLMEQTRDFSDRLHPRRDGRSSERILDAVDRFRDGDLRTPGRKPLNLLRRFKIRKKLRYFRLQ
jgi:CDP-glycerol glycerophosphotransferase (TagB/SpsB family)